MKWLNLILLIARGIAAGYEAVQKDIQEWNAKYRKVEEEEYEEYPESAGANAAVDPNDPNIPANTQFMQ